jgi:hypothetical protein
MNTSAKAVDTRLKRTLGLGQYKNLFDMNNIKIRNGVFEMPLELEHASIKAGFPSPADD